MTDHPTATGISSVCIHIGDEHHTRAIASERAPEGSVFVGLPHLDGVVQFAGSPAQLRSLAAALLAGADDIADAILARTIAAEVAS